jgi:hypothetical protein
MTDRAKDTAICRGAAAALTYLLQSRLKSFYETIRLPKLDGKFIDAVFSKKQRFLPSSAPNIDTACDVVVVPHHVGSIFFHDMPPPTPWLNARWLGKNVSQRMSTLSNHDCQDNRAKQTGFRGRTSFLAACLAFFSLFAFFEIPGDLVYRRFLREFSSSMIAQVGDLQMLPNAMEHIQCPSSFLFSE